MAFLFAIAFNFQYKISGMEINDKLLKKLSQLSALRLDEREKAEIKKYLQKTLSYFEKIKKIKTEGAPPLTSPFQPSLNLRADKPEPFPETERLLRSAPEKQGALVKVPPTAR